MLLARLKSGTCLGCHAIPGYNNVYPTYKVPKLAGQHADYIVSALKAYQNNERQHPTMHANAMGAIKRQGYERYSRIFRVFEMEI